MLVSLGFRPKPTVDAQDIGVNYLLGSISLAFKSHSLPVNGASQYPKPPFVLRNQTYGKRKSLISSVWKSMETKREGKVLCFSFLNFLYIGRDQVSAKFSFLLHIGFDIYAINFLFKSKCLLLKWMRQVLCSLVLTVSLIWEAI